MTALPDYEEHDSYSKDDVEHIVARRMAAIQLKQLQDDQIKLRTDMMKEIGEIKSSIKELVAAWESAGALVKMVKVAAGFVTAILVLWGVVKGYGKP